MLTGTGTALSNVNANYDRLRRGKVAALTDITAGLPREKIILLREKIGAFSGCPLGFGLSGDLQQTPHSPVVAVPRPRRENLKRARPLPHF